MFPPYVAFPCSTASGWAWRLAALCVGFTCMTGIGDSSGAGRSLAALSGLAGAVGIGSV